MTCLISRSERTQTPWSTDVYQIPDSGARKRVPHQPLPDPPEADRDGARPLPDRAADKDMVPEQANEAKKRDPGHQRAERTGKTGTSAESRRASSRSGRR